MLASLGCAQEKAPARHAKEVLIQEVDEHARRIILFDRAGEGAHASDPLLKGDHVGRRDVERV